MPIVGESHDSPLQPNPRIIFLKSIKRLWVLGQSPKQYFYFAKYQHVLAFSLWRVVSN